jgi:hypothetical protein
MKRYVQIIALVATVACAFTAGVWVGDYRTNKRVDTYFNKIFISQNTADVRHQIQLLELAQAGDYIKLKKMLESFLDIRLASLAPYVIKLPINSDDNYNDVIETIKIAKTYREKYPEHQLIPNIENSVRKTLDFVKDR